MSFYIVLFLFDLEHTHFFHISQFLLNIICMIGLGTYIRLGEMWVKLLWINFHFFIFLFKYIINYIGLFFLIFFLHWFIFSNVLSSTFCILKDVYACISNELFVTLLCITRTHTHKLCSLHGFFSRCIRATNFFPHTQTALIFRSSLN